MKLFYLFVTLTLMLYITYYIVFYTIDKIKIYRFEKNERKTLKNKLKEQRKNEAIYYAEEFSNISKFLNLQAMEDYESFAYYDF